MTREQILEERCERFKKLLLKNIPYDAVSDAVYGWQASGEITYNDARYLTGLVELDDENSSYIKKPPLGIMPKNEWDFIRRNAISNAIARYMMAGECVPKEWVDEYNELCKEDLTTT